MDFLTTEKTDKSFQGFSKLKADASSSAGHLCFVDKKAEFCVKKQ